MGSVVELFTDWTVWEGIRDIIAQGNANAVGLSHDHIGQIYS